MRVLGLEVVLRLGDHEVVDEHARHLDQVRVQGAGLGDRLDLGDHDAAGVAGGLRDRQDLHLQALVLEREVAVLVRDGAADQRDVDREGRVEQPLLAAQLEQLDVVLGGPGRHPRALDPGVDERAQADLGDQAGPVRGDLAVELADHALRQVVRLALVLGDQVRQGGRRDRDAAVPALDQALVAPVAHALVAAVADRRRVHDREVARRRLGEEPLLDRGDRLLVDAGETEPAEGDGVPVLEQPGRLGCGDDLCHVSALLLRTDGSSPSSRDHDCGRRPSAKRTIVLRRPGDVFESGRRPSITRTIVLTGARPATNTDSQRPQ